MKVGILTFPNSPSYGATLQMYALYKTVCKIGNDVEIINYHNSYMKAEKHIGRGRNNTVKYKIKNKISHILHRKNYLQFRRFERNNLKLYPEKPIVNKEELKKLSDRYDAVICGSDQVWNPDITDSDVSYFFDFCGDKTKRISYAASFGKKELSEKYSCSISRELEKFSEISVRENSGKAIVAKIVGKEAALVSDPIFFLNAEEWRKIEKKHPAAEGKYILYYTVSSSAELWRKCLAFSERNNIKIIVVGGNIIKKIANKNPMIEYAVDVSPEQWLYLVDKASYVFTNSFHGTAFSLNFRKNFFVKYPVMYSTRLEQLVTDTGMEKRVINGDEELSSDNISFEFAEEKMNKHKEFSLSFLENALLP